MNIAPTALDRLELQPGITSIQVGIHLDANGTGIGYYTFHMNFISELECESFGSPSEVVRLLFDANGAKCMGPAKLVVLDA